MTIKRYLADPQTTSGSVTVTEIIATENQPIVRLAETWFHPQGGGQKADKGTIGTAAVTHVGHNAGSVDHFVNDASSLVVGETYPFQIDQIWRNINAAYHTAGHLIASIVERQFSALHAIAGHQWPGEARVEFEGAFDDNSAIKEALENDFARHVSAATPVKIIGDPYNQRAIQIGDYTPIPCGGTHVSSIDQIGRITIDSVKKKSGKIRVSYTVLANST